MRISRRAFLGGTVAVAAGLHHRPAWAGAEPDLIDVSGTDPKAMVAAAFAAFGGIQKLVKPGAKVVLKPNFSFDNPPEWATGTHPDTLAAVIKACLDAKAEVTVIENPLRRAARCLERTGVGAVMAAFPAAKLKLLSDKDDFQTVPIPGAVALKSVDLAKALLAADVYINLPQAKAHGGGVVSFGLKNAMGVIRDRKAFHGDLELHQAIADLARVVKPHLTLLDATRVLLNHGPAGPGDTEAVGRMVLGRNVVSVDAYGLTLAKFDGKQLSPDHVKHIALAGAAGLGEIALARLKVKKVAA